MLKERKYEKSQIPVILTDKERKEAKSHVLSTARWFWYIAGLSALNSIFWHYEIHEKFLFGLGATDLFREGLINSPLTLILIETACVLIFIVVGFFARLGFRWAFIGGLVLYGSDMVILVIRNDISTFLLHSAVLGLILRGLLESSVLKSETKIVTEN